MFHVEQRKQEMKKEEIIKGLKNNNVELLKLMRLRMIEIKKVHKKGHLTEIDQVVEMISKIKLLENLLTNYLQNEMFISFLEEKLEE